MNAIRIAPLLVLSLCTHPLEAQFEAQSLDPLRVAQAPHGLVVQLGLEPHLVMSVGYLRGIRPEGSRASVGLGAGVKFSPYLLGEGAGRLNLMAAGQWMPRGRWGATATTEAYLARGRNRAGTIHGLGLELRAAPGYYGTRWSAAADLGWQGTLLSHIQHSAAAREAFDERYPGEAARGDAPVDGWYGSTAHRFRLGLVGGRRLTDGLALQVAAGSRFSIQRQGILLGFAHGQVPVYLETALRFAR